MDWLGLGTGAIQTVGTIAAQSAANQAQYDLNLENRAWSKQMWDLQNHYNHPAAIRARLQYAGINPALALQDGKGVVTADQPNTPDTKAPDFSLLGAGINSATANVLQAENVRAQSDLLKSQKAAQDIQNLTLNAKLMTELENLRKEGKLTDEKFNEISQRIFMNDALFDATQKKAYADVRLANSQTALNEMAELTGYNRDSREWQLLEPTVKKLLAGADLSRSQANVLGQLSPEQRKRLGDAIVRDAERQADAEDVFGYKMSGESLSVIKRLVRKFLFD